MKKITEQKVRKMVAEESMSVLDQFNVDIDGYEISNNLKETFEKYDIEVSEETLTYLAKLLYADYYQQLDKELEDADE